jgi:very-short-patch-repair endonuclease
MARANGRRNLKVLEQALPYHEHGSAGFRSRKEARVFARLDGLPEPRVNVRLNGEEADLHWPQFKLVVEVDGPGHARPRTRNEDARKERAWEEAGYEVLRSTDVDLIRSRLTGLP